MNKQRPKTSWNPFYPEFLGIQFHKNKDPKRIRQCQGISIYTILWKNITDPIHLSQNMNHVTWLFPKKKRTKESFLVGLGFLLRLFCFLPLSACLLRESLWKSPVWIQMHHICVTRSPHILWEAKPEITLPHGHWKSPLKIPGSVICRRKPNMPFKSNRAPGERFSGKSTIICLSAFMEQYRNRKSHLDGFFS